MEWWTTTSENGGNPPQLPSHPHGVPLQLLGMTNAQGSQVLHASPT